MKKLLAGCFVIAVLGGVAVGVALYFGYRAVSPMIDNASVVRDIQDKASREGVVKVGVNASIVRDYDETKMAEMADMVEAGAVALTDDAFPVQNSERMRRIASASCAYCQG